MQMLGDVKMTKTERSKLINEMSLRRKKAKGIYKMSNKKNVKMSAPWDIYYRRLYKLFGEDPEIEMTFDRDDYKIVFLVNNEAKADAIGKLLPVEVPFGNITVKIKVIPANGNDSKINLIETAFNGNPVLDYIASDYSSLGTNPVHYVVFRKEVVQYYSDDLGDINGLCSTLFQNIAKDVLGENDGIHYCTNK